MERLHFRILAAAAALVTMTSCATTSVVDTWRNSNITSAKYRKLLVVRVSQDANVRRVYEDVMADELKKRGIAGVPAYTALPGDPKVGREALEKAVNLTGADAVLTVQTVGTEVRTVAQPGYGYWYPSYFPTWNFYGYYSSFPPPESYYETYKVASIQVNLFDAKSGSLVWAATLKTTEPARSVAVSRDIAKIVADKLTRQGLL
jgi:hypothetical protein